MLNTDSDAENVFCVISCITLPLQYKNFIHFNSIEMCLRPDLCVRMQNVSSVLTLLCMYRVLHTQGGE